MTGEYHSVAIAERHGLKRRSMWWYIHLNGWKKELELTGKTSPEEPEWERPKPKPPEVWAAAEADFMRGKKYLEIGKLHDINPIVVQRRAIKYHWKNNRDALIEANRKRIAGSVQARMAHFEELSGKFLTAASLKLEQMLGQVTRASVEASELDKLIKMHASLYDSIKKIPQMGKQAPNQPDPKLNSIPPAQRPAPVLQVEDDFQATV